MKKTGSYILIGLVLLALAGVFYAGYTVYPKVKPCPQILHDTVYVKDTTVHYIRDTIPYYIVRLDTIIHYDTIPMDVDTAEILRDYFAMKSFTRTWTDSLLTVTLKDVVSRNSFVDNTFSYTILRPQQVINNIINISPPRYLIVGAGMPLKVFSILI